MVCLIFFTAMIVSTWFNKQNKAFSQLAPSETAEFFQRDSSRYQPQRVFAQESKFLQSHPQLKIYPHNLETRRHLTVLPQTYPTAELPGATRAKDSAPRSRMD